MLKSTNQRMRSTLLHVDKEGNANEKRIDIPSANKTESREILIRQIEDLTLTIIQQICTGQSPSVSIPSSQMLESIENTSDSETLKYDEMEFEEDVTRTIDFSRKQSRNKFALMMKVMATAHQLLLTNFTITRRSFYYDLKNDIADTLAPTQTYVDLAVNDVAELLGCAPWNLRLVPSSKGLISGDITLYFEGDQIIDCTVPGGALIPQIIPNIVSVRTRATFVLVVEKDAMFQILLEDNITEALNCILITGKGYPDVATRMLVKLLSEKPDLPVYIVVDADPFGMDIMCVYRFGSAMLWKKNDSLICPRMRWLGIHPTELSELGAKTSPLSKLDLSRLTSIENRSYMTETLLRQTRIMRRGKAEIEAVSSSCRNFLTATYLSWKIKGNDYI
ncbi:hypothetical protein KPH14_006827 [Odynerus spinipes]|uniref:DNA topoisomerase (ATP-hydrolyzing) n=1 Tax=Odynerus spinipes TaxID=1348599 RepID=A0AAD9VSH7_9HYME|nr:hypothetical protein KPH14_006827 [Odynerus spinipes]